MEGAFVPAAIAASAACFILLSNRSLKAPFFSYMKLAGLSLACTSLALYFSAWPPAGAVADLCMASFGAILAMASWQLRHSFMLAGEPCD